MVAKATLAKQGNALLNQFVAEWTDRYKRAPDLNRYREKWGFQDMIEDLGYDRAMEIIRYYFSTDKSGHPVAFLLNNYDKINKYYDEKAEDLERRRAIRAETAARVREWEARHGE